MSIKKTDGPADELTRIRSELEALRSEVGRLADGLCELRIILAPGSSSLPFDGNVTTPDPTQSVPFTIGTPLQIVLQFNIPGDAGTFTSGQVNVVPDDGSTPVTWQMVGSFTTNIFANTVTFSVMPTAFAVRPRAAKNPKSPKHVVAGTGRGTVIHTKGIFGQYQARQTLSLTPH